VIFGKKRRASYCQVLLLGFSLSIFLSLDQTALGATSQDSSLIIRNVTLIDGTGRQPRTGVSVFISDKRIERICECEIESALSVPIIDGSSKYLMPGLWDTHIHLEGGRVGAVGSDRKLVNDTETGIRMLHGYIYSGVTSVYDAGNHDKFIFGLRTAERNGEIVSPRIFATGQLVARRGGYASIGGGMVVEDYSEGVRKLDRLFEQGPDLVKFIRATRSVGINDAALPTIPLDLLDQLIVYSNRRGFRTTIHAVDEIAAEESIGVGVDALAHPVYMTPTNNSLATRIATKQIPVSTTLVVLKNIARIADDPSFFDEPLFQDTLSKEDLAHHRDAERKRYRSSGMSGWADQSYRLAKENVRKLYQAGAVLALGTDRTIAAMVHQELELLVEAGIPPLQAIKIGTLNGAAYLNLENNLGSIEVGKIADMILLSKNPLADIRNTRSIDKVFKDGKVVDRSALTDLPINQ
jgi:imidazolonepropionase-like amidohydrolase